MSVPVIVERENGKFVAAVVGHPLLRAEGPTGDAAVASLRADLSGRTERGELVWIDVPRPLPQMEFTEEDRLANEDMLAMFQAEREAELARDFPE